MHNQWIFLILSLLLTAALFLYARRLHAISRVRSMSVSEKLERIKQIAAPFGFQYKLSQDIFTSRTDAWQRDCGYCSMYDKHALFFHMAIDCEPVYFDYAGATWLVEFWKGQYGIAAGCEIGIYKADRIIKKEERETTLFHTVPDADLPVFSFTLLRGTLPLCRLLAKHWWPACFLPGYYSSPEALSMKIAVSFPSTQMCRAFTDGLLEAGYEHADVYTADNAAVFTFDRPRGTQPLLRRTPYAAWVQFKNRVLILVFLLATRPFLFTADRMILLYEYLPVLLRHILKLGRTGRKISEKKGASR